MYLMLCEPADQGSGEPFGAVFLHAVSGPFDFYYLGTRYAGSHLGD